MRTLPLAIVVAGAALSSGAALARGGMALEPPWNPDHVRELPAEVQAGIAKVCGSDAHAVHYFATYLGHRIKLHFERAHCRGDQPLCNAAGCLHQEYDLSGGHYRLLRSYYAPGTD